METQASTYLHPRGDAASYCQPSNTGVPLGGVRLGNVSIQSTDPAMLQQVADELASAAAQMRRAARGRADFEVATEGVLA